MKLMAQGILVLCLVLALGVACSQNSGLEEKAAAPQPAQTQPQAAEQVQKTMVPSAPVEQEHAAIPASEAPAAPMAQEEVAPPEQAASQTEEISGTVVRTEDGIALFSDTGHFLVEGSQLDDFVGKNVKVTATLTEGAEKPTINVISVSVIESE